MDPITHFKQQLTNAGFNQQNINQLVDCARLVELPTRHILLNQGQVAEEIFFLIEGVSTPPI